MLNPVIDHDRDIFNFQLANQVQIYTKREVWKIRLQYMNLYGVSGYLKLLATIKDKPAVKAEIDQKVLALKKTMFKLYGVLPSNVGHGSSVAVKIYGCNCNLCVSFKRAGIPYLKEMGENDRKYFAEHKRLPRGVNHSNYGYNIGCRCQLCLVASKENLLENKNYFAKTGKLPSRANHNSHGYEIGCRCEICTTAFSDSKKKAEAVRKQRQNDYASGKSLAELGVEHGPSGYVAGCRCDQCKTPQMNAQKHKEHFLKTGTFLSPKTKHGTTTAYRYGCRCKSCKTVSVAASSDYKNKNK